MTVNMWSGVAKSRWSNEHAFLVCVTFSALFVDNVLMGIVCAFDIYTDSGQSFLFLQRQLCRHI